MEFLSGHWLSSVPTNKWSNNSDPEPQTITSSIIMEHTGPNMQTASISAPPSSVAFLEMFYRKCHSNGHPVASSNGCCQYLRGCDQEL
jgi:hypothetical protein